MRRRRAATCGSAPGPMAGSGSPFSRSTSRARPARCSTSGHRRPGTKSRKPNMRISALALLLAAPVSSAAAQAPKAEAPHSCPCPHPKPSRGARADPPPPVVIDSVVPDGGYEIGLAEIALGTHYRSLWATKIGVPVLDLQHYAGGLKPLKKGGGRQTL